MYVLINMDKMVFRKKKMDKMELDEIIEGPTRRISVKQKLQPLAQKN